MPLSPNTQFGQYRLVRLLGRGGMGEVYEAEHRVLQRRYALKLLPEDFATRSEAVQRFEREAAVMANLEHPHIVRVDEFGQTQGRYWLRMELVRGVEPKVVTLADYAAARGGKIAQEEFAEILKQILEALAYAHGKGVVHRDLKPGNVLLETDTERRLVVKVSDFGLARVVGEEFIRTRAQISVSRSLGEAPTLGREKSLGEEKTLEEGEGTSTRALLGTWEYMSPEQRRGEEADARSDVYAVGLMCYRLLTGEELGRKAISELVPGASPAWDSFVDRAIEQKPSARYADGRAMLEAFEQCQKELKSEIRIPKPEPISKSKISNRKSKILLAAGLAALVLLGLAGWYFGVHLPEQRRKAELARIEAEARAAKDAAEKARLEAEAERLRTEREKQLAAERAKAEAEARERERLANAKGGLLVQTTPSGATVTLGGEDVQQTPATFKGVRIGKYPLRISLEGYETVSREVEIRENEFTDLGTIRLVRSTGSLKLSSAPVGAEYELSGPDNTHQSGRTPAELSQLPTGEYRYTVKRGDWEQSGTVTVERNQTVEAKVEFAYGSVRITSEPAGATVTIGDRELGRTPLELAEVRPGQVDYTLKLAKHKPATVRGQVEAGKRLLLSARLEKLPYPTLDGPWTNSLGMAFVPVPGTEVLFCIWETRVKDYREYARANSGVDRSWENRVYNGRPVTPSEDCPVVGVNWEDAKAFCEWLTRKERQMRLIGPDQTYRLPQDWEWSVAVGLNESRRGTPKDKHEKIKGVYPWGTGWPPPRGAGNYADATAKRAFSGWGAIEGYEDGYATTAPVGSFAPNKYGLYDLGGNVWEWCEDEYSPASGSRVLRGASWDNYDPVTLLSSYRNGYTPVDRNAYNGFRCVLVCGSAAR